MKRLSTARHSRRLRRRALQLYAAVLILVVAGLWARGRLHQLSTPVPAWPEVQLRADDRLLILAPHPDDEVLCCGGLIQQAVAMGLPVRVVFFTYGDNNQWSFLLYRKLPVLRPSSVRGMGLVRHDEAVAAAKALGLSPEHLTFLGYPDFGTLHIWNDHWASRPPFRSLLTNAAAVPYANALRPGAPYKGEEVVRDLTQVLRETRPTKVFVSHPADTMPDHRALYLFTRIALWNLDGEFTPEVYPYLVHFRRWPRPRGFRPDEPLEPPAVLQDAAHWISFPVTPALVERKRVAVRAHQTQYGYSAKYLLSFIRPNELFGTFPAATLGSETAMTPLQLGGTAGITGAPEELTDAERAAFVGLETRSIALDGRSVVLRISFSRPLARAVEVSVSVFGYRSDRLFEEMPKLHVTIGALTQAAYDQRRRLPSRALAISRDDRQVTVRVPLETLGYPHRILTSARTSVGDVPLDWVSWRELELAR